MGPRSALIVVVSCVLLPSPCAAQEEVAPSSERIKGELETDPREVLLREARGRITQGLGLHRGPPALSPGAMDEGLGRAHEVAWRVAPSAEGEGMPLAGGRAPVEKAEFILLPVTDEEARRDPELKRLRRVALKPHDPRARGFVFRAIGGAAGRVRGARVWLWLARAHPRRFSQIHLVSLDQESGRPRFVPLRLGEDDEYEDEDEDGGDGGVGEVLTVEEQEADGEIRSEDARGDEDQEEKNEEETETRRGDAHDNWKDDREDEHGDDDKTMSSPLVFHVPASRLSWLGARSFALRLRCRPACEGPEAPPVFVVLSAVPTARARLGRGVHGNSAESLPAARIQLLQVPPSGGSGTPHCHREATLISFEELGWAHWIVYPKNFTFYRCRGTCPTEEPPPAAPPSPPPSSAAVWWWRWRRGQCCAPEPGALGSLRVRTTSDGGFSYRYESVGGLVVRACACL
ncbi:inhibin alpha chain [Petromyzon marinus]|uniref:inhibin alpha chain n=1 Tax=Petromyzon marinus TaxID=7757 RepID=UPI003F712C45